MSPFESTKTLTAERVHLYVQSALSAYPALQANAKMSELLDACSAQLVLQLKTWCMAGRIPTRAEEEIIEWPDGVWQMFKQKFMPHWFVERFPVCMTKRVIQKNVHIYFVCPHTATDPQHMHVKFMATGTDFRSPVKDWP